VPTESKRSRSYRKDDDGNSGSWKRRNDEDCSLTDEDCAACKRTDCPMSKLYDGKPVVPEEDA
jgi:hypothetical protein